MQNAQQCHFYQCELAGLSHEQIEQRVLTARENLQTRHRGGPCMCDYYGCEPCILHRFDDYLTYLFQEKKDQEIQARYYDHWQKMPGTNEEKEAKLKSSRAEAKLDELRRRGII